MAKRKTSLGCLFWLALILLVLVVFFFNRDRIMRVMEETGFITYITSEKNEPNVERKKLDENSSEENTEKKPRESREETKTGSEKAEDGKDSSRESDDQSDTEEEKTVEVTIEKEAKEAKESEEAAAEKEEPKIEKKLRKSTIYFVSVNDAGKISLEKIIRPVYYTDNPLTSTLNALLEGLTAAELNKGLLNLIPDSTDIRAVWIEEGTAYIDFSEDIRFNPFGSEGLRAAIRQVVYTATEFSSVNNVQILINGEQKSYLSSEGIPIGSPVSRGDFASNNT